MNPFARQEQPLAPRLAGLSQTVIHGLEVPVADSRRSRLAGLAWLDAERAGTGLLIPGCSSVHTVGMRFRIDILFLEEDGRLRRSCLQVPPNRCLWCPGAKSVLELVMPGGEVPRPRP